MTWLQSQGSCNCLNLRIIILNKVQLFWEGHSNLRNFPHGLDIYLVDVQTMRKIAQIFVASTEKLNFKPEWHFLPFLLFSVKKKKKKRTKVKRKLEDSNECQSCDSIDSSPTHYKDDEKWTGYKIKRRIPRYQT